ncbi:MAG: FtsX-like permease family protein, partial [Paracoccaceae bacterium]
ARSAWVRGRVATRAALSAIGGPRSDALPVILSLGLGLSVLAAVGQIDWNMRRAIATDLPDRAPAFFFVDIQPDQIDPFLAMMQSNPAVTETESAPMLRGIITQINGRPAREVAGDHWVVRGDRGLTYSASPPAGTKITAGSWWPADYTGPPQISFAAEEAAEMGLHVGDMITVNILGRDITAEITSFREVDFSNAGMGFVLTLNPAALAGAPHTHIATVYAPASAEAAILKDVTKTWPNITAIRVREAVDRVTEALTAIATATAWAAAGTLITGFVVLIGAAAAGERARVYEAALLKTLGATRARVLASFALRSALLGAAAGLVAVAAGGTAGWAVMRFVMQSTYVFEPISALAIIIGGVLATLIAGLAFAARPLSVRPAQVLRAQD